jgi:hypothetical protein
MIQLLPHLRFGLVCLASLVQSTALEGYRT